MDALPPQQRTIPAVIAALARSTPGACAVLAPGRKSISYKELDEQIRSTAQSLASGGFGAGSRIGLALPNGPEAVVALLAVMSCATSVPLNPNSDEETIRALCRQLRVDALLVPAEGASVARTVGQDLALPVFSLAVSALAPAGRFELIGDTARPSVAVTLSSADDVALVLHTSGTTGKSKAVPLTHRIQHDATLERARMFQLTARDRSLCLTPAFTASSIRRSVFPPLVVGGSVICPPGVDVQQLLDWLSEFEPTFYAAGPAVHSELLEAIARRGATPRHALRLIFSGATVLPHELRMRLEETFGATVIQTYAMTEAGTMTQDPLSPALRRRDSVGLPIRSEVAILGDDGEFLPAGEAGEIVVRGPEVFGGYEGDADANRRAFFGDWFRTGDLGLMDADGYLYLTGRLKEIINRGGFKVPPPEVDAVLMRHPAVADAATFAVAHATLGEDVVAAVVLREGHSATAQQLRDFAFGSLSNFKVPSRIVTVASLPRSPLGKVRRRELADLLAAALQPAFDPPRDPHEKLVAELFEEVLGVERVGCFDNFFALGGDSLRGAQIASRVNAMFDCRLDSATLFRRPTVVELAAEIAANRQGRIAMEAPIVRLPRSGVAAGADDPQVGG